MKSMCALMAAGGQFPISQSPLPRFACIISMNFISIAPLVLAPGAALSR
jgi:hypothetical protein